MTSEDSSLRNLRDEELVILTMEAISAGPLTDEHGELIEPMTEQAKAANSILDAAIQELLSRANGKPIAIHFPDGRELRVSWEKRERLTD
jgi:hypothetical protein